MGKLLGIFAHPDDESITAGGTLAKYAKAGWQVDLVIVTRIDEREKELKAAVHHLGLRSVTFLDYKDGALSSKVSGDLEDNLTKVLEESTPDVIITHEPGGTTHHPDHMKLSLAVTFAFQKYAWDREDEPKLYYSCIPETIISFLVKNKLFPAESHGAPITGVEDKRITTVINITKFASAKKKALEAHISQSEVLSKYLVNAQFFTQEFFVLRMIGRTEVFVGKNDRVSDRL